MSDSSLSAKIADFGLAKNFQEAGLSGMTATGYFGGSLRHMPREQFINFKYARPCSDVWSMGATIYQMLTGVLPKDFPEGRDPMKIVLSKGVIPLRERDPSIPAALAAVIDQALMEEPGERYQDAGAMLAALQDALAGTGISDEPGAPALEPDHAG